MNEALVKNNENSDLEIPLQGPLRIPRVTLHLEAIQPFEKRFLCVSFTTDNGWNVKEVEIPISDALNNPQMEMEKKEMKQKLSSKKSKKSNKSKKRIRRSSSAISQTKEDKLRNDQSENIPEPEVKKVNNTKDSKKLKESKNLLFGANWFNLAPNCFQIMATDKKRYQCVKCSFTSTIVIRIAEHFYVTHNPAMFFKCLYCSKEFKMRQSLKSHLVSVCKFIPDFDKEEIHKTSRKTFNK